MRVTGSVEKLDDEMVAPTVSIPLIAALALFWEKAGIVRDPALEMLREALAEAMTAKVKEDASIKDRIKESTKRSRPSARISSPGCPRCTGRASCCSTICRSKSCQPCRSSSGNWWRRSPVQEPIFPACREDGATPN